MAGSLNGPFTLELLEQLLLELEQLLLEQLLELQEQLLLELEEQLELELEQLQLLLELEEQLQELQEQELLEQLHELLELLLELLLEQLLELHELLELQEQLLLELVSSMVNNRLPVPSYVTSNVTALADLVIVSPMNVNVCSPAPPESQTKDPPVFSIMNDTLFTMIVAVSVGSPVYAMATAGGVPMSAVSPAFTISE